MYIIKIKGTTKIPDYVQIRDEDFTLIAYFKVTNPKTALSRSNLLEKMDQIMKMVKVLPYGKIKKLEL
ncbi:MAG: fructose-6-phosphate aldolase [bacterium]